MRIIQSSQPLERFARICMEIQRGTYPNCAKLAQQLEVSKKTVHRDLEFLRDRLQVPIEYDPRRWGFYLSQTAGPASPAFMMQRRAQ